MTGITGGLGTEAHRTTVLAQIELAHGRSRRRFSATFVATWIALVLLFGGGAWLASGADINFVFTSGPVILSGAGMTILVSALSITFATGLALLGAMARLSTHPIPNGVGSFYVSLFRGTPLLLQIIFMYYALPYVGIRLPALAAGVLALSLNYGAYMTEIFRAGIQAVPRSQREAGRALGMPERLVMRRIVMPQAVRIVIPAVGNEFIAMIKDSSLVSVITIHETLFLAQRIGRSAFEPVAALLVAGAVYWTLTIIFSLFQDRLERRLARSDR
ncbi:MAG TPA: amino acid ABC transporter permease [candidate division Zixibacteria bacterium]|nr:amino acid ABC transporter permease [candidate division Zixibacteria bacterium]